MDLIGAEWALITVLFAEALLFQTLIVLSLEQLAIKEFEGLIEISYTGP